MTAPAATRPRRLDAAAPGRGPGPLSLLAACLLPVIGAVTISSAQLGLEAMAIEVLAVGWLTRNVRASLRLLTFGLLAAGSIALSTYLYGGREWDEAAGAASRILYMGIPTALLTPRIRPAELGDHLAQRMHLPARAVVAAVAALLRINAIGEQWRQVQWARRARGLGLDGSPVRRMRGSAASAFALLVVTMRHTGMTSVAMDARGFATAQHRTWAGPAPWRAGDWLVLGIGIALAVLPWSL
ncbi:MAG: energy-coupling factor transporter transmembrane component T family protein [Nocardioidaceae bacterium]